MRLHRLPKGLWILLFAGCVAGAAILIWNAKHLLYPTPENESAFMKHYNPEHVISRFRSNESFAQGNHGSSAAGWKYVSRTTGFDSVFVMCTEKSIPLMNALRQDVSEQLRENGAQILAQIGDSQNGFRFDYKSGHVIGSVTILPLIIGTGSGVHRASPLPQGLVDVKAQIEETEKWFPEGLRMVNPSL